MLRYLTGILFLSLMSSCTSDEIDTGEYPACMQPAIDNYLTNYPEPRKEPATITQYNYHKTDVFVFDPGSGFADWLYTAVDGKCNVICESGGITGIHTCKDWDSEAKFIKIVWKDKR